MQDKNQVLLDITLLHSVLDALSARLLSYFPSKVRIIVHGGAVMVLHKDLARRKSTRDVDCCLRSFEGEWTHRGVYGARAKLDTCIYAVAEQFGLGRDWMNADADVALPWSYDQYGQLIDPIYQDAIQPGNVYLNTIYDSPGLMLVGVSWPWAVALKLVRYQKDDPNDIAAILSLGSQMKQLQWTRSILEGWLMRACQPMGYASYPLHEIEKTRAKMRDAIQRSQQLSMSFSQMTPTKQESIVHWLAAQARPTTVQPQQHSEPRHSHSQSHTSHSHHRLRSRSFSQLQASVPHHLSGLRPSSMPNIGDSAAVQSVSMPVPQAVQPIHGEFPKGFMPLYASPTGPQIPGSQPRHPETHAMFK